MAGTTLLVAEPTIVRLDWECDHFGWLVAQLSAPDLTDADLATALRHARQQGVRLLVWPARAGRDVPRELLDEFAGTLVDRKATFCRPLQADVASDDSPAPVLHSVIPYAATSVSTALGALAISAGVYSRFRVDPHFPREKFEAMYLRWIEGSVIGELADMVLVVPLINHDEATDQGLGGMITLSESNGVARIGLVAVATEMRGAGVGSALMLAAHQWMRARDAREAQVVTQLANLPAGRLYERSGYRLTHLQHYYHFWL